MRAFLLLFVLLAAVQAFAFERFEGTYYLDRDQATWVIVMRGDKTYEIFGPDGLYSTGRYRSTEDHLTFLEGEQKRRFHYDWDDGNLKFGYRESENITPSGTLARVPPSRESQNREHYISEANWRRKGRPVFVKQAANAQPPVVVQAPPSSVPATPPSAQPPVALPSQEVGAIAGNYYLPAPNNSRDLLAIGGDGRFEFTAADGTRASGSTSVIGNELLLLSATHQRGFIFRKVPGGLELTRKQTDVVKTGDVLGTMPPQDRDAFTWLTLQNDKRVEVAPGTGKAQVSVPVSPPSVPPPANVPPPQVVAPVAGALDFGKLIGTFVHKPNPFISETLVFGADGKFSYKDSNGAGAQGVFSLVDGVLTITSGEVIRKFTGATDGKILTLNCAPDDAPKFKNDLASMSPTVLKTAKYEKQ